MSDNHTATGTGTGPGTSTGTGTGTATSAPGPAGPPAAPVLSPPTGQSGEQLPAAFGRYVLHRLVAEGGMAEIFLAEQLGQEGFYKIVALKRMLPHLCRQPEFVAMFLDEVRLCARLNHPNIVQVFDFGEVQGRYFISMEYLAGENLGTMLSIANQKKQPLPLPVALQIMLAVCDGLHYAHDYTEDGKPYNIVHRDISPSNIAVTYQGVVKLLDFGIARARDRRTEATETGVVKGKFPYCSPEQIETGKVDRRSDLFSLGIVFHEMLTGRRLFKRETDPATCLAVIRDPAPPPSATRVDVPRALDEVILKALRKRPEDRYQTVQELRRALEQLITGPPAHLDDYLRVLVGDQRITERSKLVSSASRGPTGIAVAQQSYVQAPALPASGTAVDHTPVENVAIPTKALRHTPAPQSRPTGVDELHARKRNLLALLGGAGVAAVAVAGLWLATRPKVEAPVAPAPVAAAPAPVTLEVDTAPRGASIEVAGKSAGLSPAKVENLAAGELPVRVTLKGYKTVTQTIVTKPGETRSVLVNLVEEEATLEVATGADARVSVDGIDRGESRKILLPAGEHLVRIEQAGYQPFEQRLTLEAGERRKFEAPLVALAKKKIVAKAEPGALDVSCNPWCRVFLDGNDVGKPSPLVNFPVPSGQHTLRLEHPPSGRSREVVIDVKPGGVVRQTASFR